MSTALEDFASRLGAALPVLDDPPLARALVRTVARGQPVSASELAVAARRAESEVHRVLSRWSNVRTDARGHVVGFMGLSLDPTRHEFEVDGRGLYTSCAWDTLFLPAVLHTTALVRSRCPVTDTPIRLVVTPTEVEHAEPRPLHVSFPSPAAVDAGDIVGSLCCHVHFLAGDAAAERWSAERPDTLAVTLDDAFLLGAIAVDRLGTAR